jgi:hypothetical protein
MNDRVRQYSSAASFEMPSRKQPKKINAMIRPLGALLFVLQYKMEADAEQGDLRCSLFFTLNCAGDPLGRRAPAKGDACRRSVAFCVFAVMTATI